MVEYKTIWISYRIILYRKIKKKDRGEKIENRRKDGNGMNIREQQEAYEKQFLSPYAAHSVDSKGRDRQEEPCDMRTIYQRDRDRILHSKSFRRLIHKTQVFLSPEGDHYRTRLTHTLEVSQIARTIARSLRLNEALTEAIALGHDLGHTPFGHTGEEALNTVCETGFWHEKQSVRIVEFLEKGGLGLNLTKEVRDGILNHRTNAHPSTLEGQIVRLSDKIAYINHDIDDAIRGKILTEEEIPKEYTTVLGTTVKERLNHIIHDIVKQSAEKPNIVMSKEFAEAMKGLRKFMFQSVYTNSAAKSEEKKAKNMIIALYHYYLDNIELLPSEYIYMMEEKNQTKVQVVCDYIAGMTDSYSIAKFKEIFEPRAWKG